MTLATSNADTPQADSGHDDPYRWLWLSEAEAEHYGARSTLRRYVNEGRFPTAEKVGRSWRVRKYDLDRLTPREREVLQLVAEGQTNRMIAQKLGLSPKTVDSHRTNLMRKLGLHDAQALTRFAVRRGLISPE